MAGFRGGENPITEERYAQKYREALEENARILKELEEQKRKIAAMAANNQSVGQSNDA